MKVVTNISIQYFKMRTMIKKKWLKPACNAHPWVSFTFFKFYKWYLIAQSATCSIKLWQSFKGVLKKTFLGNSQEGKLLESLFKVSRRQRATLSKKFWTRLSSDPVFSCELNFSEHIFYKTLLGNWFWTKFFQNK